MKVLVSQVMTHYHEIELNDELDVEKVIQMANTIQSRCEDGCEAIEEILKAYKKQYGFDYEIVPDACGKLNGSIEFENFIEY